MTKNINACINKALCDKKRLENSYKKARKKNKVLYNIITN